MSRAKIVLFALPLVFAAVVLLFGWNIHAELAQGKPVFWLAELWTPAAVMTIVLVVCIDFVASPAPAGPPKSGRRARPKARPGKAS